MGERPALAGRAGDFRESVFASLARKMRSLDIPIAPLHIGDTWISPPAGARLDTLHEGEHPRLYDYAHPAGLPALREALAARLGSRLDVATSPEGIQVTCGATQALLSAGLTLFNPGDEVLVLAPYWPLIAGVLRCSGADPRAVPFYDCIGEGGAQAVTACLEAAVGPKTRGIYFNTPNNPTGVLLGTEEIDALVAFAAQRGLWLLSDEAYADYVYAPGREHVAALSRPGAAERTVAVYTFSKSHGMAGNRVGFCVAPPEVCAAIRRVSTHNTYSTPTGGQLAALAALDEAGDAWQRDARALYAEAAERASAALALPHLAAGGGSFLFCDLGEVLDRQRLDTLGFISRCLDHGVALSPGAAFGPSYERWARICFTAAPPDAVEAAVRKVNEVAAGRIA